MDFGRKIMEKYGYKEGSGLGKLNNGIVAPVKASFKFDQTGLSSKNEASTTDHWWSRIYKEAANNIQVDSNEKGDIAINLNDKEGVEITNKSYSMKKLKESGANLQYGNFLKSATLLDVGGEKELEGHVSTADIEIKPFHEVNDDELFKACEGRTAHKGARHGLNLSGKLQRIAEQERQLLERMKQSKSEVFKVPSSDKKRPLLELNSSKDDENSSNDELPLNLEKTPTKNKKKSKKHDRKKVNQVVIDIKSFSLGESQQADDESSIAEMSLKERRKEKKKLKRELEDDDELSVLHSDDAMNTEPSKKKKKKRKKAKVENEEMPTSQEFEEKLPKNIKKLSYKLDGFHLAPKSETPRIPTPARKKKTHKKIVPKMLQISEENPTSKRLLDIPMEEKKLLKVAQKRIKLSDDEEGECGDDVDKLNAEHHLNRPFKDAAIQVETSFESSSRKEKRSSKKKKDKGSFSTNNWEMKLKKKHDKSEKKKLKRLKNMERREVTKEISKKALKKLKKKEFEASTDVVLTQMNTIDFS